MSTLGIVIAGKGKKSPRLLMAVPRTKRKLRFEPSVDSLAKYPSIAQSLKVYPEAQIVVVEDDIRLKDTQLQLKVRPLSRADDIVALLPVFVKERWEEKIEYPGEQELERREITGRCELRIHLEAHLRILALDQKSEFVRVAPIPIVRASFKIIPLQAIEEGWDWDFAQVELEIRGAPRSVADYRLLKSAKKLGKATEALVLKSNLKPAEQGSVQLRTSDPTAFWYTSASYGAASPHVQASIDLYFGRKPPDDFPYRTAKPKRMRRFVTETSDPELLGGLAPKVTFRREEDCLQW